MLYFDKRPTQQMYYLDTIFAISWEMRFCRTQSTLDSGKFNFMKDLIWHESYSPGQCSLLQGNNLFPIHMIGIFS